MAGYNFTSHALIALQVAREEAQRLHSSDVGVQHLLLALGSPSVSAPGLPLELGTDLSKVRPSVHRMVPPSSTPGADLPYSDDLKAVLDRSIEEARGRGHPQTMSEHLFLALLTQPSVLQLLGEAGVEPERLRDHLVHNIGSGRSGGS